MLFLYRPRQTWMPYTTRRSLTEQGQYNRQLQERFAATQRVPPRPPSPQPWQQVDEVAALKELAQLHATGALTDAEFTAAKARILGATS
jgi:hypothetical protein